MLDANPFAGMWVGPSGRVPGGEDAGRARLQVLVHRDTAVHSQPCLLRERQCRLDADAHDDEVAVERGAAAERHGPPVNPRHGLTQMEGDAVRLVQRPDEPAHLDAEDALEWRAIGRDYVDGDVAGPQRCCDLQADEAGTHYDHVSGLSGPFDDGAAVRERAEVAHLIVVRAGNRQSHRIGAGRQE